MTKVLKELREERGLVEQEIKDFDTAIGEQRMTEDQNSKWNSLTEKKKKLDADIETEEQRAKLVSSLAGAPVRKGDSEQEIRDKSKYSYARALRIASGDDKGGIEEELSQEARSKQGSYGIPSTGDKGGVVIPGEFLRMEKRAHTAGTTTAGGHAIQTQVEDIIPYLNPNPVTLEMGATSLTGLTGPVSFPRGSNTLVMDWKAEAADADEKSFTLEKMDLTPKELTGFSKISKTLMMQTGGSVERWLMNEISSAIARSYDAAAINGSGVSPIPAGILNTSGIGSVAGGTNGAIADWADVVNLVKEVEIDNAYAGNLGYLTTPQVKALFSQTGKQSSGVEGNFILNNPNELYGHRFKTSTLVPSNLTKGTADSICHAIIFGNWAELYLAQWGGIEIVVDPYSLSKSRQIQIVATIWADVALRHAQSFAAMKDALVA